MEEWLSAVLVKKLQITSSALLDLRFPMHIMPTANHVWQVNSDFWPHVKHYKTFCSTYLVIFRAEYFVMSSQSSSTLVSILLGL
jgi:hypothetical protein